MRRRQFGLLASTSVVATMGVNYAAFAQSAVGGMKEEIFDSPGDGLWTVPAGVSVVIAFAIGGGGGGGNTNPNGQGVGIPGEPTSFNKEVICLGAPGAYGWRGGQDDIWYHTKGGNMGQPGGSTSEAAGGASPKEANYSRDAMGGGGGAGAGTKGIGGEGGDKKHPEGNWGQGYGSGGGGAFGEHGWAGGGGGGCREQCKVVQIPAGTEMIPYYVGKGGGGAGAYPGQQEKGGDGGIGHLRIYYCSC